MLKFDTLPPTPGTVELSSNALDELYLSHSHLGHLVKTAEVQKRHLESVRMLGGLAADMLIINGASVDDSVIIGAELNEQIRAGAIEKEQFAVGFGQGISAHENNTRISLDNINYRIIWQ